MNKFIENSVECTNYGYSHYQGVCENKSKWMASLGDNKRLSQISIPGTHDTMSQGCGGDIVQTQSKSLEDQLTSGIRYLDIRLGAFPDSTCLLYAFHGSYPLGYTFSEILDIVTTFLKNNPSETILMRIKQEFTDVHYTMFKSLIDSFVNNCKYTDYIYKNNGEGNPSLNAIRGKFMILQDFSGLIEWVYYKWFTIQDDYYLRTNWDLYSKWEKVKNWLIEANKNFLEGTNKRFINYLSGSWGAFPYFVASGHSSPETNAPFLATGLTEPAFHNYYPDFPRINWFGGFATIAFEGTNYLTKDYINKNKLLYVGIIAADFPGQGLINSVINVNFNQIE